MNIGLGSSKVLVVGLLEVLLGLPAEFVQFLRLLVVVHVNSRVGGPT